MTGWLLDASVNEQKRALTLWIKVNGKTRGYDYYEFKPSLFVDTDLMRDPEWSKATLLRIVQEHQDVVGSRVAEKYVSIYDDEKKRVMEVFTEPDALLTVARDLERLPGATVFHADIDTVHQFFITNDIFPFGRVEFELDGERVKRIKCIDSREDVEYDIPDFEMVFLEVSIDTDHIFPRMEDPIHQISLEHNGTMTYIGGSNEREILTKFQDIIDRIDPDVIATRGGDDQLFRYLTIRSRMNDVQLLFSRDGTPLSVSESKPKSYWQYNQIRYASGNRVMFNGRLHIDRGHSGMHFYSPTGMEGVIESCRISCARPQQASRMTIGAVNAASQYYTAYKMDILIPPIKRNPEFLRPVNDLVSIDRGGLIFQPRPDIYEEVAECDFVSMYPTLMVIRNISPETICTRIECPYNYEYCIDIPGLRFRICGRRRGIVSEALDIIVRKRTAFKAQARHGNDAQKYRHIENTLKGILVSCFGYLGFKNARFGRVEAHTAVTALARDVLLKTRDIGEEMGFSLIHGIVDSIWLKSRTGKIDIERVDEFCRRVTETVGIQMSSKGVYRWMVIPSSRMHPTIAPLNRYYGVFKNGSIKTRGIETRRRDTCLYVGDCQKEMIKTLARGGDRAGFLEMIPTAYAVCQDYIDRLYGGDVDIRDLVLHTRLTREPNEYRSASRASIVAKQLVESGRDLHAGQKVGYVMVQADSESQMRRVKALELVDENTTYDAEAYAKLCLRAFESLIPVQYLNYSELERAVREWALHPLVG
ncbi:MAG: DNA polymerase domain-containing protein [Candidatus Thorarchaeota archaeon]